RVEAASTAIGSAISLARAQALGNRRYVAVVIPATTANGNADLQPYIYKGYRLCFVNHTGNNYVFDAWLPDSKWQLLPEGTAFLEVSNDDSSLNRAKQPNLNNYGGLGNIKNLKPIETAGAIDLNQCAIIFTPFGGTINDALYIWVTEGVFNSPSSMTVTHKDTGGTPLDWRWLKVNKFTGKVSYE
ncbi:MAG: hypothetical protein PHQ27_00665, partial [Victivallales bacterium]|nr:hypothetical protein [Victivallales bacterium]